MKEDKKGGFVGFNQQDEEHPAIYDYVFWPGRCYSAFTSYNSYLDHFQMNPSAWSSPQPP